MKKFFWLILIVFLAFGLRFYHLSVNPPSLSWDEASIGYNAYSIDQTLKDEHGVFLPLQYFAAFGDYKPPVSIYLTAISVKLFGFNTFGIRFPSAFLGVLTVILTYFLCEELRRHFKTRLTSNFSFLTSFFLAISPWHTLLSRADFEANMVTFFVVLGAFLILKGLEKGWYLPLAAISFVLSLYTFNSARIFVPIFLFITAIFFRENLWKQKKWAIASLVLGVLLFAPLVPHLLSPLGRLRFQEVNIFTDEGVVIKSNQRNLVDENAWWAKVIHNRRIGYGLLFLSHYFDHFNIDYLFFNGDINPKFSDRTNGEFFLIEVLFLVIGTLYLWKKERKLSVFIFFWLLIGLIPASTARETPHALRTEVSLPAWQMISAAGLYYLYEMTRGKWRKILFILVSGLLSWEFFMYLHNYYVHYPIDYSQDWEYGYKLAAQEVAQIGGNYKTIWVSDKYGRPYIFMLTYLKYSPSQFQKKQKTTEDSFGFYTVKGFDKFVFGNFSKQKFTGKILLIGAPGEIPGNAKKIEDLKFLSGETALEVAEL